MAGIMDRKSSDQILNRQDQLDQAAIFQGNTQHPFSTQTIIIALDTARGDGDPYKVGFPFKSVFVKVATDTTTTLSLKSDTQDLIQSGYPLTYNDALEFTSPVSSAYLTWAAQSGKSMTLVFSLNASIRPGSQLSISAGGTSISEGSSFVNAQKTLVAATALSVFSQNFLRKVGVLQNTTGASIWVGAVTVTNSGATIGIEVPAGGSFIWKNTAQLYAYSIGGGLITTMEES